MRAGPINVNQTALTDPNEGFIRRAIHDFSLRSQCHLPTPELELRERVFVLGGIHYLMRLFPQLTTPTDMKIKV